MTETSEKVAVDLVDRERRNNAELLASICQKARHSSAPALDRDEALREAAELLRDFARNPTSPGGTIEQAREGVGKVRGMRGLWLPIAELADPYQQPLMIASPKLIDGDSNPHGISNGYWQDDFSPDGGEWRTMSFDMCSDEWNTISLTKEDVTHFLIPEGPWLDLEAKQLEWAVDLKNGEHLSASPSAESGDQRFEALKVATQQAVKISDYLAERDYHVPYFLIRDALAALSTVAEQGEGEKP